ncbi:MAG: hypothetical protein OHM56_01855 [Spiroplasma phoeniceum]|nr:MAG: hypothetical protein OHM57_01290 [Spiroplasma phoeniceum]UZQ32729.1 MAG: hypothetical protein OHM56_01855 [Spiroplasma phoeniceum]
MARGKTKVSKDHDVKFKNKIINEYYEYNKSIDFLRYLVLLLKYYYKI